MWPPARQYLYMLRDAIQSDLKQALKSGDAFAVSVLRMAQSAMQNKALEKRARLVKEGGAAEAAILTDEEVVLVLRSEVKRRKDAASEYEKGNRPELAHKELEEAVLLGAYLPKEADDAVIEETARLVIEEVGSDPKRFGRIMGLAMGKLAGLASGERVSAVVRKMLGM